MYLVEYTVGIPRLYRVYNIVKNRLYVQNFARACEGQDKRTTMLPFEGDRPEAQPEKQERVGGVV